MDERDPTLELIDKLTLQIREHVDTVQVFVTIHGDDSKKSTSYEVGFGNFYARQGQVEEWLVIQKEYQRLFAQKKDAEEE